MGKAASPALTAFALVVLGAVIGATLWFFATSSGLYIDAGSGMDVIATVICYENKSMLILNIRTFESIYIDSVTINGYRYSVGASVFGEKRLLIDGEGCPCKSCDRGFVDGELVTGKDVYRINVFVVKALAKPSMQA